MSQEIRWGGHWKSPEMENPFGGELFINQNLGVICLTIFHLQKEIHDVHATKLIPDELPLLYGELSNGTKITLCNCRVTNRHSENFYRDTITIHAETMFLGEHQEEDLMFDNITYILSNVIEWSGLCRFIADYDETTPIMFKWENETPVSVPLREGVNITFSPKLGTYSIASTNSEYNLSQEINITFEYSTPTTLNDSLKDIQILIHLIDLAIEDNIFIKKIYCFRNNLTNRIGPIPIETYIAKPQESSFCPLSYYNLFSLQSLCQEDNLFQNWFDKYPNLKPIISLYTTALIYPQMPREMIFLNTVQALETYHGRFVCKRLKSFKKRVEELLKELPEEEQKQHKEQFLSTAQMDTDYIILKSRLCDLFICNFEFGFPNFYEEQYPYALIDSIVDTRHYFTHYGESKEDKALKDEQLEYAIRIMRQVLEFYFMKEIGFSIDYIKQTLYKRKLYFNK